ncbi:MAG: hypothetical protein ICV73_03515 [Acetobacteraceae bacterium]|nr:hypothetical protein [Acetobacteraceae bacterium]
MARVAVPPVAVLALLAALAGCTASPGSSGVSASDGLPTFGWPQPRMRPPSTERPAWLAPTPAQPQRLPAPDFGFRA